MSYMKLIAAAAVSVGLSLPAAAATWNLTGNALDSNSQISVDGVTATVWGGAYRDLPNPDTITNAFVSTDWVVEGGSGLGIDRGRFDGGNIDGSFGNDLITFVFDTVMNFSSVTFGNWGSSDSFDLFVDGVLVAPEERTTATGTYDFMNLQGSSISFGADAWNDRYRVASLDVAPVPLPAAGFLLLGALGGAFAMRRKKRS